MPYNKNQVLIVGGGIAGLCCAKALQDSGIPFLIVEQSDSVGGRIRTDRVDGFLLDRGFQALQTAYPEAQRQLDYNRLDLKPFLAGSLVRHSARFHRMIDPWRRPLDGIWSGMTSSVGTIADKLRIGRLRYSSISGQIDDLFEKQEQTTYEALKQYGFSERIIDQFFRPFLGGIFLERNLTTSSRMLHFVFRMMSLGEVALPAAGMQSIPEQLAEKIPKENILLNTRVEKIGKKNITLEDGSLIEGSQIVIATPGHITAQFLGQPASESQSVKCLYYSCEVPPLAEPILVLNGEAGPINNLSVPSVVAPQYAPPNKHLVSISVLDNSIEETLLETEVVRQATHWFGDQVQQWRHLKTYDIKYALPSQAAGRDLQSGHAQRLNGMIICGDSLGHASIQSALRSGREAAEFVLEEQNATQPPA